MDASGSQLNLNMSEQRQYIIPPASSENPRNISSEPMTQPPLFLSAVREPRTKQCRYEKNGAKMEN